MRFIKNKWRNRTDQTILPAAPSGLSHKNMDFGTNKSALP
jgi:hypothetical protein